MNVNYVDIWIFNVDTANYFGLTYFILGFLEVR